VEKVAEKRLALLSAHRADFNSAEKIPTRVVPKHAGRIQRKKAPRAREYY
jgi:hypothetical protein